MMLQSGIISRCGILLIPLLIVHLFIPNYLLVKALYEQDTSERQDGLRIERAITTTKCPRIKIGGKPTSLNNLKLSDPKASVKPGYRSKKSNRLLLTNKLNVKSTRKPAQASPSLATSLISSKTVHYDARDVTYFLESHLAHSTHDPRAYFTEERTTRSLSIMLDELPQLPNQIRFAYVVRVFNELGRKIASKLNYFSTEIAAILKKTPDDLGNKPEVSMLVDAVEKAFESKVDKDPREDNDDDDEDEFSSENLISELIYEDDEKKAVFNAALRELSTRFAHLISYFVLKATKTSFSIPDRKREDMADLLGESLKMGAKALITELSGSDKYRITEEVQEYLDRALELTQAVFKRHIKDDNDKITDPDINILKNGDKKSFKDLNPISDSTGLIGTWNTYLFSNLGSSERVIKLFASLLSRVPPEAKSRWINMHVSQMNIALQRTLSGFVVMQGMPQNRNVSEIILLNTLKTVKINPSKLPAPRANYTMDRNRVPARCYLAGRRWRLVVTRGLQNYASSAKVITDIADNLGQWKLKLVHKSGNEIYRLCMPRVEVGLRGWGINGDPQNDESQTNKFKLKNPLEGLNTMDDPFTSGAKLGYIIGFKVGYNEERNATLELENASKLDDDDQTDKSDQMNANFIAKASFRKASTAAAEKAFQIAVREGYSTSLKISVRAGMQIPAEAGSRLASMKCASIAGQVGLEAGRTFTDSYLLQRDISDKQRKKLTKIGENIGQQAGKMIGETIGAIVGKAAGEEAFKRAIVRGGKLKRSKFQLEEYESGAELGFKFGIKVGKQVASSSSLDPSAPKFFRMPKPTLSKKDKSRVEVDHWEKDLIPTLTRAIIDKLESSRNVTRQVRGSLKGIYKVAQEVKRGFKRVSYSNITYDVEVTATGFIKNNMAYLTLNGTVDRLGPLYGTLIASDVFNEDDDDET